MLNLIERQEKDNKSFEIYDMDFYRVKALYMNNKLFSVSVYKKDYHDYNAEIQFSNGVWGNEPPHFTIQTTAYGDKDIDEIAQVIKGYQAAIEAVKELTEHFCR